MIKNSLSSWGGCFFYSAPHVAVIWLLQPLSIVQGIYAKYYGLSLSIIAVIVLVSRLFDAITDPLVGFYVDRRHQRTGSHKLFVLSGSLLFIVSAYFLYSPPVHAGALYFTVWFMCLYLAFTLYEISHLSWASSLAFSSQEKTRIYSSRSIAGYLGAIGFYAIPFLPWFESNSITPETLRVSVIVVIPFMLLFLFYCLKKTPDSTRTNSDVPRFDLSENIHRSSAGVAGLWSDFFSGPNLLRNLLVENKPFMIFLCAYSAAMISTGMWFGLIFIYVDVYLGLGDQFASMFILAFFVGILCTPGWYKIAILFGKKNTWLVATVLIMISFILTGSLSPENASTAELLILKVVQTLGFSCVLVVAPAMLSEVAAYGQLKTGVDKTATYFSLYTFFTKTAGAGAAAFALGIAGYYGFDASEENHDGNSVWGLMLAITWLPIIFSVITLMLIAVSPIDENRHSIIQRRLARRSNPRSQE